ncbi:AI-2E family transporter [Hymenobacter sp. BT730]|uniref:AI-2E family transporter n=1 Tax=Hymenobacter sp. BT730 TaxID=3063332 RepID=UPI0026DEA280|nr:AI-2E family transporter [Hymenobacter sp. BT730]
MPENNELKFPLYVKAPLVMLGVALVIFTLHIASNIIFPLFFAAILAILLHPVEQFLLRCGVPRLLAITLTVILGVATLVGLLYFIYVQAAQLGAQLPQFKARLIQTSLELQQWLASRFGISNQRLMGWLREAGSRTTTLAGGAVTAISGLLVVATLIPVYIFLLLLYKRRLIDFLTQVFSGRRQDTNVAEVLHESKATIQSYMVGLLIEASIVATLNTVALLIIGVPYALLLGVVGALLNFIPYIGGLVAVALPMLMAFVSTDGYGPVMAVLGAYLLIQFIDNHYLIPRIVASKVKVNALVAIVGVLVGNSIGGVAGMFLALPVIAILKIIFDRIEPLKPWGLLLGDEEATRGRRRKPQALMEEM